MCTVTISLRNADHYYNNNMGYTYESPYELFAMPGILMHLFIVANATVLYKIV